MAALEVQNVKRAISRYGTLPKGARIGAYLESLRQSGLSNQQEGQQKITTTEQTEPSARSLSPRTNIRTQPQMIRSNSSSGVTTFHHAPSSPARGRRTASSAAASRPSEPITLRTFRVGQAAFRGGSPSRAQPPPSLADLEFPPPPTDLPPPPEEFDGDTQTDNATKDEVYVLILKARSQTIDITVFQTILYCTKKDLLIFFVFLMVVYGKRSKKNYQIV